MEVTCCGVRGKRDFFSVVAIDTETESKMPFDFINVLPCFLKPLLSI